MKKALFSVLFLCFLMTHLTKAQDTTATKCNKKPDDCSSDCSTKNTRFWYDAGIGMQALEMSNLNTKFKDAGFNEVATRPLVISLAGGMIYKKHSFGFSMSFASPKNRSNNQLTEMSLIRSDMMYGYSFKLAKRFTFVPTIGIAITESRISLQKSTNNVTLAGALAGSLTSTTLTSKSAGVVIGTKFILRTHKKNNGSITLNLNYYLPVENYDWRSNGQDIDSVPKVNFGGFTATLGVGMF